MPVILLKKKPSSGGHLLVITGSFKNNFHLPAEAYTYMSTAMKTENSKSYSYNHLGRVISVFVIDEKLSPESMAEKLRVAGSRMADAVNSLKGKEITIVNETNDERSSLFAAEGMCLGSYQFITHITDKKKQVNPLETVIVTGQKLGQKEVDQLNAVCDATLRARDLVNEPVNVLNAVALAGAFKKMGSEAGFRVQVLGKADIRKLKMGGVLAVNAGSVDEPTFTVMEYKPARPKNKHPLVLVGKGVTYDTGGLSLKPTPNSMDMMKCDMAGGAAVGCALYAIAKAKLNLHVIGLVPATDNRPGFNAFAPGDVITMMDGSTVEMLNSDAEGRMILADALHYAKRYKPELVIDIATLTGAAVAAIGSYGIVGMGTATEEQRGTIVKSGLTVHERIAEFPFWDEYSDQMKSDVADQKNLGGPSGGAITAGKFLQRFTDYPYYHLDIAGPAFLSAKDAYRPKGGTGVGVRLFFELARKMQSTGK
jgi:leucyl aminopeptidase